MSEQTGGSGQAQAVVGLSPEDQRHLEEYEKKRTAVRDFVLGVAEKYDYGFILHGAGGLGKSYTVLEELRRLGADYHLWNTRMTPLALFNMLRRFPDAIHILEDMERLVIDPNAQSLLRSALWGQRADGGKGPEERTIEWSTGKGTVQAVFTGGIILTSNRALPDTPELQALATRVSHMELIVPDSEVRAFMRHLALQGYDYAGRAMPPEECSTVAEFVIAESAALARPLDIRLLVKSYKRYLQWSEGRCRLDWRELVRIELRHRPTTFRYRMARGTHAAQTEAEEALVRDILKATSDAQEQLRLWQERTGGKSRSTFYRRKADVERMEWGKGTTGHDEP